VWILSLGVVTFATERSIMKLRGEVMLRAKIEPDFRITLPEPLRDLLRVGDELLITTDQMGRIIITPKAHIRAILQRTAGMWRGRQDLPADGVEYVNQMRQGCRLHDLGIRDDGD
jgi:bifunctional DNA-binding transcriptional regulator/antitoxin component of YhaV-PrlF toxin-antitoxin module